MQVEDILPTQLESIKAARTGNVPFIMWAGAVRSGKTVGNCYATNLPLDI